MRNLKTLLPLLVCLVVLCLGSLGVAQAQSLTEQHLRFDHGVNTDGMTEQQMVDTHTAIHGGCCEWNLAFANQFLDPFHLMASSNGRGRLSTNFFRNLFQRDLTCHGAADN